MLLGHVRCTDEDGQGQPATPFKTNYMQRRVIRVPGKFMIVDFTDSIPPTISETLVNLRVNQSVECEIYAITGKDGEADIYEWVQAKIGLIDSGFVVSIPWDGQYVTVDVTEEHLCNPDMFRFKSNEATSAKIITSSQMSMKDLKAGNVFRFPEDQPDTVRKVKYIVDNRDVYVRTLPSNGEDEVDIYELSDRQVILLEEENTEEIHDQNTSENN